MRPNWSRRSLLSYVGVVSLGSLGGCINLASSSRGVTDVVLHNEATGDRTIDVTVTGRGDDTATVDVSIDLKPNERHTINNEVVMGSDYDVEVAFTDESSDASAYRETQAWKSAHGSLHVIVHDQIVFAVQIG